MDPVKPRAILGAVFVVQAIALLVLSMVHAQHAMWEMVSINRSAGDSESVFWLGLVGQICAVSLLAVGFCLLFRCRYRLAFLGACLVLVIAFAVLW